MTLTEQIRRLHAGASRATAVSEALDRAARDAAERDLAEHRAHAALLAAPAAGRA